MPSDAHKLMPDGSVKDVPLSELAVDDKVLIKPGEKFPRTASLWRAKARLMKRCSPAITKRRPNGSRTRSDWMNTSPKFCPGTSRQSERRSIPGRIGGMTGDGVNDAPALSQLMWASPLEPVPMWRWKPPT